MEVSSGWGRSWVKWTPFLGTGDCFDGRSICFLCLVGLVVGYCRWSPVVVGFGVGDGRYDLACCCCWWYRAWLKMVSVLGNRCSTMALLFLLSVVCCLVVVVVVIILPRFIEVSAFSFRTWLGFIARFRTLGFIACFRTWLLALSLHDDDPLPQLCRRLNCCCCCCCCCYCCRLCSRLVEAFGDMKSLVRGWLKMDPWYSVLRKGSQRSLTGMTLLKCIPSFHTNGIPIADRYDRL